MDETDPETASSDVDLDEGDRHARPTDRRRRRDRWWTALGLLGTAAAVYTVLPTLAGLRETIETLVRLRWWLPGFAVALEAVSLTCYAELLRTELVTAGSRPSRRRVLQAVLVGTALGKLLPGGTVAALAAEMQILRRDGVDPAVATAAVLSSGIIASLLLVVLLPLAAAVAIAGGHQGGAALGILGVSVGTAALAVLAWIGVRDPSLGHRLGSVVRRLGRRGPPAWRSRIEDTAAGVERAAGALRSAARDRHGMIRAACFAAGRWLFDFAVLAVIALASTRDSPLAGLALAYVVGQLASAIPITPGGIGVVETTMTGALVAQGMTAGHAAAVVLAWRLISHWLPIVVGLIAHLAAGTGSAPQPDEPDAPTPGSTSAICT